MITEKRIKIKAMCLFVHGSRVLLQSGASLNITKHTRPIIGGDFYRVIGGSFEFNESSEQAIRREIKEELGSEIDNLQFIQVIENRFLYKGEPNHEIVFLYKGDLRDSSLYKKEKIHIIEPDYEFDADWVPIEKVLNKEISLFPPFEYSKVLV